MGKFNYETTVRLKAAIAVALRQEAEALRREIVQGLTRQAPGGSPLEPPKETTLAARRLKGFGGSKSLIVRATSATASLRSSAATRPSSRRTSVTSTMPPPAPTSTRP